ncbi:MAG TPA: metallophosphoesterase [Phycisphaerae bacterium]
MNLFRAWIALSSLSDWFIASRLLGVRWWGRPGRGAAARSCPRLHRVIVAAAGTSLFFLFKLLVLTLPWAGLFGAMTMAYADIAIVLPLLGFAVLRQARACPFPKPGLIVRAWAWLSLLAAPICAYATFIEPYWLVVERTPFEIAASRWREHPVHVRVAVLADLQTSAVDDYDRRAVQTLMAQKPDVILIAGDLFTGSDAEFAEQLPAMRELLSQLHAPGGVYAVEGDCDSAPGWLEQMVEGTPIRLLRNEITTTRVGGLELTIGGVELAFESDAAQTKIAELSNPTSERTGFRILLTHRPDPVLYLPRGSAIDLVVAGHTHGGQVQIPGFGPLVTFTQVPRSSAGGGASVVHGHRLYVSRGVGHERQFAPRLRLFCRPEISLLTLQPR